MRFSTVVVQNQLPSIVRKLIAVRDEQLLKAAKDIQKIARDSMEETKSGVHWVTLPNRSSAPGEAPAIQFDALHSGLQAGMEEPGTAAVWSEEDYAPGLEFGTRRVVARPFLGRAAYVGVGRLITAMSDLESKLK